MPGGETRRDGPERQKGEDEKNKEASSRCCGLGLSGGWLALKRARDGLAVVVALGQFAHANVERAPKCPLSWGLDGWTEGGWRRRRTEVEEEEEEEEEPCAGGGFAGVADGAIVRYLEFLPEERGSIGSSQSTPLLQPSPPPSPGYLPRTSIACSQQPRGYSAAPGLDSSPPRHHLQMGTSRACQWKSSHWKSSSLGAPELHLYRPDPRPPPASAVGHHVPPTSAAVICCSPPSAPTPSDSDDENFNAIIIEATSHHHIGYYLPLPEHIESPIS
ncbi:hypothetical protein CDD80_6792 [Ophiocordyceps camponoti-rufipedis]|uniref:Uncharacterized protein n=1 Tax=Ophiocordyceps camponoti-rufipedis TaxID=2004952 RepID=A0A2C5YP19_9HYPO|nr:hypothetical protein CDD80_6792 [Ophiocordyceps camponoti-rufipedis]